MPGCGLGSVARPEASNEAAEKIIMSRVTARSGARARAAFERANPGSAKYLAQNEKRGKREYFQRVVIFRLGNTQSTQKENHHNEQAEAPSQKKKEQEPAGQPGSDAPRLAHESA